MNQRDILWMGLVVLFSMACVCPAQVDPNAKIYWVADDMAGDASGVAPIPEPTTLALLGMGLFAAVGLRKRLGR